MQHTQLTTGEAQVLLISQRLPQFPIPLRGGFPDSQPDRMVVAEAAIDMSTTVQPKPVAVPAEWLALIGDDPYTLPPLRHPVSSRRRRLPFQGGQRIPLPDHPEDLLLRQ